jgi:hypothetical protein
LNHFYSRLDKVELALLRQSSGPALNDRRAGRLVKDAMRLETIVRMLAHKDFGLTQLHIRLGEHKRNRLVLHTANLFRPTDTRLCGIKGTVRGNFIVPFALFQRAVYQSDAQVLSLVSFHTPRKFFVRRCWKYHSISLVKGCMRQTHRITGTSDTNGFQHTTVSQLLGRSLSSH